MKSKRPLFGLSIKVSLFIGFLVLTSAGCVGLVTFARVNKVLVDRELRTLTSTAGLRGATFGAIVDSLEKDVLYQSTSEPIEAIVRAPMSEESDPTIASRTDPFKRQLERQFIELLRFKPEYLRVRLIGTADGGREIVRVENRDGMVVALPPDELQRKGEERYFQEAIGSAPGSVYLSHVELNRDQGKITEPHMATLRAAVPLRDPSGAIFGLMVINMNMNTIFEKIGAGIHHGRELLLANERGDFLVHPNPALSFAFETGRPYTLADEFPGFENLYTTAADGGQFIVNDAGSGERRALGLQKLHFDPARPERFLSVIISTPHDLVLEASRRARAESRWVAIALIVCGVAAGIIASRRLLRTIGGEPGEIEEVTRRVAEGDLGIEMHGDLDSATGIRASVAKMVRSLQEKTRLNDEQDWLKTQITRITSTCQGITDLKELAQFMISDLARLLEAGHGAFFTVSREARTAEAGETLRLLGSFAFRERKQVSDRVRLGEGLVGQCAAEMKPIILTNVPADYIQIGSGLGEAPPLNVIAQPISLKDELMGVIELASFRRFSRPQQDLLEQITSNLGVIMNNIINRRRTEELLIESQRLTEETQAQAEELQAANEELEEKTRRLEEQSEELRTANEEMEEKSNQLQQRKAEVERRNREIEQARAILEEKTREVEKASKYKSEFLANMSHELRTPLNSLLILAQSLGKNSDGNLTADQVESAKVIHNGGLDLLHLINDILDLSKVEAGKLHIETTDVRVQDVAASMRKQFDPVARDRGLTFTIEIDEAAPAIITTDRQRIEQIIKNLLSNAFKFTSRGSVTLVFRKPAVGARFQAAHLAEDAAIEVAVVDTGIGIPAGKQRDIFEAFQQSDGSISRKFGGTGLGLTISRELAKLLSGEIQLQSQEGMGSTFSLFLPAVCSEPAPVHEPEPLPPAEERPAPAPPTARIPAPRQEARRPDDPRGKSLLIIEDDPAFARILADLAGKKGYVSTIAGNAKDGIRMACENIPDALVLDIGLPDMNGLKVLETLKHNLKTRHIPIHVISGMEEGMNSLQQGALGYLQKPVDAAALDQVFASFEHMLNGAIKNLLIIEDEAATDRAIRELLSSRSIHIESVATGEEAYRRLCDESFDCVIMDLMLQDTTGFELLQRLSHTLDLRLPPIIIYTGRDLTRDEHVELSKYATTIVLKGVNSPERLLDEVTLFLHSVEESMPEDQREIMRMLHDSEQALRGTRVLLVDDDLRNTFALAKVLRQHGLEVVLADNGKLALERLEDTQQIDLVIMDIMMPVMDGLEAMRRIREHSRHASLPIIALTAKAMAEDRAHCLEAGASDYMTKPVDVDKLLSLMRVWLSTRREARVGGGIA